MMSSSGLYTRFSASAPASHVYEDAQLVGRPYTRNPIDPPECPIPPRSPRLPFHSILTRINGLLTALLCFGCHRDDEEPEEIQVDRRRSVMMGAPRATSTRIPACDSPSVLRSRCASLGEQHGLIVGPSCCLSYLFFFSPEERATTCRIHPGSEWRPR